MPTLLLPEGDPPGEDISSILTDFHSVQQFEPIVESMVTDNHHSSTLRISVPVESKKSDLGAAVHPFSIAQTVLSLMQKADNGLVVHPIETGVYPDIKDLSKLPKEEKEFAKYFVVHDEKLVRQKRRAVIVVTISLMKPVRELKADYASGLMPFLSREKIIINETTLGYCKHAHVGHVFQLQRCVWKPGIIEELTEKMQQAMTIKEVKTFLGETNLPVDFNNKTSTAPRISIEVDSPGYGGSRGTERIMTSAFRIKCDATYAKLAMEQLTRANNRNAFPNFQYVPPRTSAALGATRYIAFLHSHNNFLDSQTIIRVKGLTERALDHAFTIGTESSTYTELLLNRAKVVSIERTMRSEEGHWILIVEKKNVGVARRFLDEMTPKIFDKIPDGEGMRIDGSPHPRRTNALDADDNSVHSALSNVSEGFSVLTDKISAQLDAMTLTSKSKSANSPQRTSRARPNHRNATNKPLSIVYGDTEDNPFPALPPRKKLMKQHRQNKTYAGAATATTTNLTQNSDATSTIASGNTFDPHALAKSIEAEVMRSVAEQIKQTAVLILTPVETRLTKLETRLESMNSNLETTMIEAVEHIAERQDKRFTTLIHAISQLIQKPLPTMTELDDHYSEQERVEMEIDTESNKRTTAEKGWSPVRHTKRQGTNPAPPPSPGTPGSATEATGGAEH